ncbi:hypothetical protein [Aestuariicoccus sp. MJ-SS9]|uniref:hypothetical protein n=1 Tax=Aestuariicoccus sp. MJ-SS9 TaxID=3079855 RepID=UPI00292CEEEB|nr:hypothetical protein [Aestuariicoccus sp. MJ-SS9]
MAQNSEVSRMLVLGVTETIQLIDGASALPTMQALKGIDQVVALGAPALAGALDAILGMEAGPDQKKLRNRVEGILKGAEEDDASGLGVTPPVYRLLPFTGESIEAFGHIREAAPIEQLDIYDAENMAIVRAHDATAMLLKTEENQAMVSLLEGAGIDIRILWIP